MSAKTFDLGGRVALVTGASGGLGLHFARTLAGAGARVVLAARRREQLEANVAAIVAARGEAAAVAMDVTDPASVDRGVAEVAERFGDPATVVVNNSGVTVFETALDLDPADWDKVMDTNAKGAWLVARAAARRMIDAGVGGSIVNIASILGFRVAGRVAPYAASKAALLHLTRALALEWARHRIRVNALAPGYVETELNRDFFASDAGKALIARIPQRRLGRPEDLDGALLLLASDASAYMTGGAVVVDGGHLHSTL
ncbi:MAG TPA: glucose 1-dehydrogenase [Geminicoccaceae bacterium]|nr:glucose 1-dehydrogenase [Geminicoccaceae bacterium]